MDLSTTERAVLMGMVTYPDMQDREISSMLDLPNSTYASAKSKILKQGLVQDIFIPIFPRLGFELLATVFGDFNPSIPFSERLRNTKMTVEASPEMIVSIGESHRGFSLSIARNVTRIMKIMDVRMRLLARLNLLEIELPTQVLFPFQLSHVHRFFNNAPLLFKRIQEIGGFQSDHLEDLFTPEQLRKKDKILQLDGSRMINEPAQVNLSKTQLDILLYLIKYPELSASRLSAVSPYSRHTISRAKDHLQEEGYITRMRILDLAQLGYKILTLFHSRLDPKHPITIGECTMPQLLQDETIFFTSRPTEMVMIAVYPDYVEYNKGMSAFNHFLKNNNHANTIPVFRNHSLPEAIWIKKFAFEDLLRDHFDLKI